jgi:transposase
MRKQYASDISREQFEKIRPMLENCRKKTFPRKVDLYDIFCAVLYILKTASQWRMLPGDFPPWQNVYAYFRIWNEQKNGNPSTLEEALKKNGLSYSYKK